MSFANFAIAILMVNIQQVLGKDVCRPARFGSAYEMVLLLAAFIVGWHLIGPLLGLLLRQKTCCADLDASEEHKDEVHAGEDGRKPAASGDLVDKWLSAAHGWKVEEDFPQPQQYTEALKACLLSDDLDSACRLLQRASWKVPGPQAAGKLLALARRLLKQRDIDRAEKCIECASYDMKADLRTRKLLIMACARNSMEKGREYFKQLKVDGLQPDFAIYSAMIRGACNVGKVEEALEYLEMMSRDRVQPDAMLLDASLEAAVSRNLFQEAERVLTLMQDLGIPPSNSTLAACIRLYSSNGDFQKAHVIFEETVKTYQLQPNSYVYAALIAAAFRSGQPETALSTFDTSQCPPSARTYEHLIRSCLQLGFLDRAVEFLDEALGLKDTARRVFIDPKVLEEVLVLIARRRESERLGLPLLKRLEAADYDVPEALQRLGKPVSCSSSVRSQRREDLDRWRSFSR